MQQEIDRISCDERRVYRKRILYYSNGRQLIFWHILLTCAVRSVAFVPSFRTCFRNTGAHIHMFQCVSVNNLFYRMIFKSKDFFKVRVTIVKKLLNRISIFHMKKIIKKKLIMLDKNNCQIFLMISLINLNFL